MFSIEQNTLMQAIQTVMPAIAPRALQDIYKYCLLSINGVDVTITGTDGEITIETTVEASSNSDTLQEVLLPAQTLQNVVRKLPKEEITFAFKKDHTEVSCGRTQFQLCQADTTLFPKKVSQVHDVPKVGTITASELGNLINQVTTATERTAGHMLANIRVKLADGLITLEGTNGHCLARVATLATLTPDAEPVSVCVPVEHIEAIARLAGSRQSVALRIDSRRFACVFDDGTTVVCPCASTDLPVFDPVLPKSYGTTVELIREEFLAALERVSFIARQQKELSAVSVEIQADGIKLDASSSIGSAEDVVAGAINGATGEFAVNPRYLIDPLKSLSAESIRLGFNGALSPVGIITESEHYTYIAMPVVKPGMQSPKDQQEVA